MNYEQITYEKVERIAYITLNRPDSLNALDSTMNEELKCALSDFDLDPDVWVAILAGNGRSFCAGADQRVMGQGSPTSSRPEYHFLSHPVNWKPVIAAVQGHCYGLGLSLAAECDIIVATEDAAFCLIETRRGMLPIEIYAHLTAWMGSKTLTEMVITADPLRANEAHRLGLVNQLVSTLDELRPAAEALARRILQNPPLPVRTAIQLSRTVALQSEMYREAELLYRNTRWRDWDDYREGMAALREKRPPQFTGR